MSDIEDLQKENDMDDNEPLSGGGEVFDKDDWYHGNISMKMMISMILVMMMIMIIIIMMAITNSAQEILLR